LIQIKSGGRNSLNIPGDMTPALLARLAALLAGLLLAGCGERAVPGAAVGERFPELRLAALGDAREQGGSLPALVPAGRDVVLNVWATWCEPCRKEMASLEALARARGRDLEVVGLSVDEDANLAREFLLKQGVSFANFNDPGGRVALDVLGVSALPQTFVIARDGTLVARITGPRDWAGDEIRVAVRDALAVANGRTR
jgi:cytochrome c biogenesis protein CcmG, thiol:disulfide interchange protein DsbE